MTAYCVKRPGVCDRANCCMIGKRPGDDQLDLFYDAKVTPPVMVKLADVIDTITTVRSTIAGDTIFGNALCNSMKADIIRHLHEKFGSK